MTEGKINFHDSCVDKPTGDNFTCVEQRNFGKCDFPFIVSPLAAQWQGGFCQRTCQRCDCSPGSGVACSVAPSVDVDASNGVIHSISRVLFPPPVFTKEQAIRDAIAYNESVSGLLQYRPCNVYGTMQYIDAVQCSTLQRCCFLGAFHGLQELPGVECTLAAWTQPCRTTETWVS
jgi:hypothetical protein